MISEAAGFPAASSVWADFARLSPLPSPANSLRLGSGWARITANPGLHQGTGFIVFLEKPVMMSLPFVLFACGLGAAWLRQREVALGFWTVGLVVLLALFRAHYGDALNIAL
jgi:hypothetical protein